MEHPMAPHFIPGDPLDGKRAGQVCQEMEQSMCQKRMAVLMGYILFTRRLSWVLLCRR